MEHRILYAISLEKIARVKRRRLIFSYIGLSGSFAMLVFVWMVFATAILKSDFWYLFSLMFSDAAIVARNWNTFLFALLETMPILPALLILVPMFTLFLSFSMYFSNAGKRHFSY